MQEKTSSQGEAGKTWYIPHHGVIHPRKPGKVRVVFDCSAEFGGTSLNKQLLSGPDLTNQLVGVLTRFREEQVAYIADIEAMFHQVHIPDDQRSLLTFLWWENGDINNPVEDYEMCVHLFGGVSSPSCCNYALKRTSVDYGKEFGPDAARTSQRNFYVDDMLKSSKDVTTAIELIKKVQGICKAGGFNLTKFLSNNIEVIKSIPEEYCRSNIDFKELECGEAQKERALGVIWNIQKDTFGFRISLKQKPATKRGMLSELSSVYDPLGLAAPFILKGRKIIQKLCQQELGWDERVPNEVQTEWQIWRSKLPVLQDIEVRRYIKPVGFEKIVESSIHHFSDASEDGYGQASYLRLVNDQAEVHCILLMGKARVSPLKYVSIPRLELVAATLSVKVGLLLRQELEMKIDKEYFWTDSKVVLGYINNI